MNSLADYRKPLAAAAGAVAPMLAGCGHADATPAVDPTTFALAPGQRLAFAGAVLDDGKTKDAGITFGVIPTSPIHAKNYNVFTAMVESRPVAGNPHPVPVLRAAKVSVYRDKPDVSKLALDRPGSSNEAELTSDSRYAIAADGKWVAYVTQRDVCVVGTDGRGWTPVWETRFKEPQHGPTFSPDSSLVAMTVALLNVMTGPGLVSVFDLNEHVRHPIEASQGADSEIPLVWQP